MVTVSVENRQKKLPLKLTKIRQIAKTILRRERVGRATVHIVFVNTQTIRALNKKYLKRAYATDVLAFDLSEETSTALAGDIVISVDAAIKNAKSFGQSIAKELTLYIIHGILHLTGYDDHTPKDIARMRRREAQLLTALGQDAASIV